MAKRIIFPTPLDATATMIADNGTVMLGVPDVHPSGRPGISFEVPDDHPDWNGARTIVAAPGYQTHDERGILFRRPDLTWGFDKDDYRLVQVSGGGSLSRLSIVNRYFRKDNERFFLNGASAFNILGVLYAEGEAGVRKRLKQRQELGFNAGRYWTAFDIPLIGRVVPRERPGLYVNDIQTVSELSAEYGQYPYWTGLTGPYSATLGGMNAVAEHDYNVMQALLRIPYALYDRRNEYSHPANQIDDTQLATPPAGLLWSQGSDIQDSAPPTPNGLFYAWHPGRGNETQRKVGKQNYDWAVLANDKVNLPGVDDETDRIEPNNANLNQIYDGAANAVLFIAGAFYHSAQAKLFAMFSGNEFEGAQSWNAGVQSIIRQGLDVAQDGSYFNVSAEPYLRIYEKRLGDRVITHKIRKTV